jgi:hypothetical protein
MFSSSFPNHGVHINPTLDLKQVSHYPPLRLFRTPNWGWRLENTNVIMREVDDVDDEQIRQQQQQNQQQQQQQGLHEDDSDEDFFDDDEDEDFEDDDDFEDHHDEEEDEDDDGLFDDVMGVDHPNDMLEQSSLQHGVVVDVDHEASWVPEDDDDALMLHTLAPHQYSTSSSSFSSSSSSSAISSSAIGTHEFDDDDDDDDDHHADGDDDDDDDDGLGANFSRIQYLTHHPSNRSSASSISSASASSSSSLPHSSSSGRANPQIMGDADEHEVDNAGLPSSSNHHHNHHHSYVPFELLEDDSDFDGDVDDDVDGGNNGDDDDCDRTIHLSSSDVQVPIHSFVSSSSPPDVESLSLQHPSADFEALEDAAEDAELAIERILRRVDEADS